MKIENKVDLNEIVMTTQNHVTYVSRDIENRVHVQVVKLKSGTHTDIILADKQLKEKSWEDLVTEAEVALEKALAAVQDLSGWSGSSGNWPLQDYATRLPQMLAILKAPLSR